LGALLLPREQERPDMSGFGEIILS
jgi:hypothetical protein